MIRIWAQARVVGECRRRFECFGGLVVSRGPHGDVGGASTVSSSLCSLSMQPRVDPCRAGGRAGRRQRSRGLSQGGVEQCHSTPGECHFGWAMDEPRTSRRTPCARHWTKRSRQRAPGSRPSATHVDHLESGAIASGIGVRPGSEAERRAAAPPTGSDGGSANYAASGGRGANRTSGRSGWSRWSTVVSLSGVNWRARTAVRTIESKHRWPLGCMHASTQC
jgi:hypothetical protein